MIAWLIGLGVPARLAKPLLIGAGIILLLLSILAAVKLHDRRVVKDHEAKIEQRAKPATDQAAAERATDAITTAKKEEDLHNVIAAQPDQPIAPTSHALACKRLSNAGKHPAACGGPSGRH